MPSRLRNYYKLILEICALMASLITYTYFRIRKQSMLIFIFKGFVVHVQGMRLPIFTSVNVATHVSIIIIKSNLITEHANSSKNHEVPAKVTLK